MAEKPYGWKRDAGDNFQPTENVLPAKTVAPHASGLIIFLPQISAVKRPILKPLPCL